MLVSLNKIIIQKLIYILKIILKKKNYHQKMEWAQP